MALQIVIFFLATNKQQCGASLPQLYQLSRISFSNLKKKSDEVNENDALLSLFIKSVWIEVKCEIQRKQWFTFHVER